MSSLSECWSGKAQPETSLLDRNAINKLRAPLWIDPRLLLIVQKREREEWEMECFKDMMKLISWMTRQRFPLLAHPQLLPIHRPIWDCGDVKIFQKGILCCHKIILHNINPLQIWILEEEIVSLNYSIPSWEKKESKLRMEISDLYGEEKIGNEANLIFNIQFPFISIFISAKNYF